MSNHANDKQIDRIIEAVTLIHEVGDVVELRILKTSRGLLGGYFDNSRSLSMIAARESGKVPGCLQYTKSGKVRPITAV